MENATNDIFNSDLMVPAEFLLIGVDSIGKKQELVTISTGGYSDFAIDILRKFLDIFDKYRMDNGLVDIERIELDKTFGILEVSGWHDEDEFEIDLNKEGFGLLGIEIIDEFVRQVNRCAMYWSHIDNIVYLEAMPLKEWIWSDTSIRGQY